jgi:hypothetical protein
VDTCISSSPLLYREILELSLSIPHSHASSVQNDDLLVKPILMALALFHHLRFKLPLEVLRHRNRRFPVFSLPGLLAVSIAPIFPGFSLRFILWVIQLT